MGKKNQTVKHPETHGSDTKLMESKPEPGIDMDWILWIHLKYFQLWDFPRNGSRTTKMEQRLDAGLNGRKQLAA